MGELCNVDGWYIYFVGQMFFSVIWMDSMI